MATKTAQDRRSSGGNKPRKSRIQPRKSVDYERLLAIVENQARSLLDVDAGDADAEEEEVDNEAGDEEEESEGEEGTDGEEDEEEDDPDAEEQPDFPDNPEESEELKRWRRRLRRLLAEELRNQGFTENEIEDILMDMLLGLLGIFLNLLRLYRVTKAYKKALKKAGPKPP
jgi:hypothetical protein